MTGGVFDNWKSGLNIGAGSSYQAAPWLQLNASSAFNYFPYKGDHLDLAFPAVAGLSYEIQGENSYAVEASAAARFQAGEGWFSPHAIIRGGIYYLRVGRVNVNTWINGTPNSSRSETYRGTDLRGVKPFAFAGVGFNLPVSPQYTIKLECGPVGTFDGKYRFIQVLSTFQLTL